MAVPMYLLYEGAILLARLMARSKGKGQEPGDVT
jgi:Sec-independent protein secretion pathway component TatC